MKRLLSFSLIIVLVLGMMAVPAASVAETKTGVVHGGWLRLRSAASFNASTISSYYTGTVVSILNTVGGWYEVRTPDGRSGYMYSSYVTVSGGGGGGGGTGTATVWSSNGYGVRMRSGPSTTYRAVTVYPVGTKVTVLERGSYWSYIQVGSLKGYMMNEFLVGGDTPTPVPDPVAGDATVWSSNGYGVRLRTGPGTGYSVIGVYSVGTPVKILDWGTVWSYIQIGSRTGYMMTEFLKKGAEPVTYEVQSVSLNYQTPVYDSTLKATVTPSGATVDYKWYVVDPDTGVATLKGEETTFKIDSHDYDGKKIKLVVTGNGKYTGTASCVSSEVLGSGAVTYFDFQNIATKETYVPVKGDTLKVSKVYPEGANYTCEWIVTKLSSGKYTDTKYTTESYKLVAGDVHVKITVRGAAPYTGELEWEADVEQDSGVFTIKEFGDITNPTNKTVGDKFKVTVDPLIAAVDYKWVRVTESPAGSGTFVEKVVGSNSDTYTSVAADEGSALKVYVTGKKGTGYYECSQEAGPSAILTKMNRLQKVVITPTAPRLGDTIKAKVYYNNSALKDVEVAANVVFAWYVDGEEQNWGNEPEFPVDHVSMIGRVIKVVAVGIGSYAGACEASTATVKGKVESVTLTTPHNPPEYKDKLTVATVPADADVTLKWYRKASTATSYSEITSNQGKTSYEVTLADANNGCKFYVKAVGKNAYQGSEANSNDTAGIVVTAAIMQAFTLAVEQGVILENGDTPTPEPTVSEQPTETPTLVPGDVPTEVPAGEQGETPTATPTVVPETEHVEAGAPPAGDPTVPTDAVVTPVPAQVRIGLTETQDRLAANVTLTDPLTTSIVAYRWYVVHGVTLENITGAELLLSEIPADAVQVRLEVTLQVGDQTVKMKSNRWDVVR